MKINVAAQLKQPGKAGEYRESVPYGPVEYLGRTVTFKSPMDIEARYS